MTATPFVDVEVPTPDGRTITYRIRRQSPPDTPVSRSGGRDPSGTSDDAPKNEETT